MSLSYRDANGVEQGIAGTPYDVIKGIEDAIDEINYGKGNHYVDITADFDSGAFSAHPERYQAGNYIKKTYNDVNYVAVLADYNTYYNPGRSDYANINVPHWEAIVFGFPAGSINSSNTTAGGFSGSAAFTWLIGECTTILKAAFGADHLKGHKCLLSNGTYNASVAPNYGFSWAWTTDDIYAMFMSEIQMHGSKVLSFCWQSSGEAVKQLEIFKNESFMSVLGRDYGQSNNNFNINHAWNRDISANSPGTDFCYAHCSGLASYSGASYSYGRFPIITLV